MVTRRDVGRIGITAALTSAVARPAQAEPAAAIAVKAARKYKGSRITILWEAGLQALDPLNYSGPKWSELTGIEVNVVQVAIDDMFSRIMEDYKTGAGYYDALNVVPAWMPDLAQAGALEVLDPYVSKYGFRGELLMIAPTYRDNQMMVDGKIYGFPDDGDVFVMYYRKDLFADPGVRKAFKDRTGKELEVPATWADFDATGAGLTDILRERGIYGAAFFRQPSYAIYMFQERFRNEGGKFFDSGTMKATINSQIGIKVFTEMRDENQFMPPGIEQWGFNENLSAFLQGRTAMTISWPPYGRWAAGYGADLDMLSWVPKSEIAGKVGYALPPGGHPQLAAGFALSVASLSMNKDAAYLFIQWLNSEDVSLQRVQLPYALRDPFRNSHFSSKEYLARWPDAKDYLAVLKQAAETGLLDLSLLQTDKYDEVLRHAISRLWTGNDPKVLLDAAAAEWDAITEIVGVDRQKAAYADWAAKTGSYPKV